MTTLIFIENVLGSGHLVKLTEDFGDYSVTRDLRPGEHTRLVISPFKTVTVEEAPMAGDAPTPRADTNVFSLQPPRALARRN